MTKSTMGTKLPRKLEQKMQIVGEQIRLARWRRNLSIAQIAERATCSPLTVSRIEKGVPTVAIGIYLRVLDALQLDDDILLLAKALGSASFRMVKEYSVPVGIWSVGIRPVVSPEV